MAPGWWEVNAPPFNLNHGDCREIKKFEVPDEENIVS